MKLPGFVGPSYQLTSLNADAERTINLYPEIVESGHGASDTTLLGTPGMRIAASLNAFPVRALFSQDGRTFAIAGGTLYELVRNGLGWTVTLRGSLAWDTNPATISSNGGGGFQLFITSGGKGYVYSLQTNALTVIADDAFPDGVLQGGFMDGYFIALWPGEFRISTLEDGASWNGLNVAQRSNASDQWQAMIIDHRELWLFGSKTTEIWADTGASDFAFAPIQGTFVEQGIIAPFSVARIDNAILWLGGDERGAGMVWRAQGYTPLRTSTHAIESIFQRYPRLDDAIAYVYQDAGHLFYVLYLPSADVTWVFDAATKLWHERAHWNATRLAWEPHRSRCYAYAHGRHLVGDRAAGIVYDLSLEALDDELATVA